MNCLLFSCQVVSISLRPHGLRHVRLPSPSLPSRVCSNSHSQFWIHTGITSFQFSCSVMSDYLWPHEPQHARPPCPSPTPQVYPNPCPLSRWCHPTISSFVVPFSSCPQSLPASESFPMGQFFAWGGQSTGVSASTSSNEDSGLISFRMDWLDLFAVQGTLKSLLQHHRSKASILQHWMPEKSILTYFSSVAQLYLTLCNPMDSSMPASCPIPAPGLYSNLCPLSQWCHPTISFSVVRFSSCLQSFPNQDLFQWGGSSLQMAKVLEFQLQHQSFQWIFSTDFL